MQEQPAALARHMQVARDSAGGAHRAPVTVLTKAHELATMERPGSMTSVRPREETRSRTVSIRSLGVGSTSPLQGTGPAGRHRGQGRGRGAGSPSSRWIKRSKHTPTVQASPLLAPARPSLLGIVNAQAAANVQELPWGETEV